MRPFLLLPVLALACSRPSPAPPSDAQAPPPRSEVRIPSGELTLHGWIFRPAGTGPFPALVYNHGSERDPSVDNFGDLGDWFRGQGYVLLLPFRRGAGGSDGTYWEDVVPPQHDPEYWPATIAQLEKESADVSNAVAWLRTQPFVDSARVSVAGCSFGGIHTLLAAEKPQGLRAAIDFAGASMSWASSPLLQQRLAAAVDHAAVPVFFVQAENDFDTSPTKLLPLEMEAAHKPHRAKIFPPHGTTHMEGHAHFCTHGMAEWGPDVLAFLDHPG
jgi:dienelactone hydrolase